MFSFFKQMDKKTSPNEFTGEPILQEFLYSFVRNGKDITIILAKTDIFLIPLL